MTIPRHVLTLVVTAILAIPTVSFAQTERGAISGLVTDETKAAVPGVAIKVINAGTNVTTNVVSSDSGGFNAANLPPGTYRLEATLAGFPNVDHRGDHPHGRRNGPDRRDVEPRRDDRVGERRRREHHAADRRREGCDHGVEQAD